MLKHIQAFVLKARWSRHGLRPQHVQDLKLDGASAIWLIHETAGQRATATYGKESGSEIKQDVPPRSRPRASTPRARWLAIFAT